MRLMVAIGAGFVAGLVLTVAAALDPGTTQMVGFLVAAAWFGLMLTLVGLAAALFVADEPQRCPPAAPPGAPTPPVHNWWSPVTTYQAPPTPPVPAAWTSCRPATAVVDPDAGWSMPQPTLPDRSDREWHRRGGARAAQAVAVPASAGRQRRYPSALVVRATRHGMR